jgi:hypothetical protein
MSAEIARAYEGFTHAHVVLSPLHPTPVAVQVAGTSGNIQQDGGSDDEVRPLLALLHLSVSAIDHTCSVFVM